MAFDGFRGKRRNQSPYETLYAVSGGLSATYWFIR